MNNSSHYPDDEVTESVKKCASNRSIDLSLEPFQEKHKLIEKEKEKPTPYQKDNNN